MVYFEKKSLTYHHLSSPPTDSPIAHRQLSLGELFDPLFFFKLVFGYFGFESKQIYIAFWWLFDVQAYRVLIELCFFWSRNAILVYFKQIVIFVDRLDDWFVGKYLIWKTPIHPKLQSIQKGSNSYPGKYIILLCIKNTIDMFNSIFWTL